MIITVQATSNPRPHTLEILHFTNSIQISSPYSKYRVPLHFPFEVQKASTSVLQGFSLNGPYVTLARSRSPKLKLSASLLATLSRPTSSSSRRASRWSCQLILRLPSLYFDYQRALFQPFSCYRRLAGPKSAPARITDIMYDSPFTHSLNLTSLSSLRSFNQGWSASTGSASIY